MARTAAARFVVDQTLIATPPLVPEIRLRLATEITPIWLATEASLAAINLPPPYWAFAWPGGQAVARYVLDHPDVVRGRRVLDFGSGSGLIAIAAALAGAASVRAADIDPTALAAIALNAALNGVEIDTTAEDLIGAPPEADIVLVGDMCYERPLGERLLIWLHRHAAAGVEVLIGDPGRAYFRDAGMIRIADFTVATSLELEDRVRRETGVWRLTPATL
jgi:predicted nicotinamide N-methyase